MTSRVDTATHGVETQPLWLIAYWLGFVEPASPREDKVPSPDQKSFRTSTTLTNQGQTAIPRVDTSPQGVEPPTPGSLLAGMGS